MLSHFTDQALRQRGDELVALRASIARNQQTIQTQISLHTQELENSNKTLALLGELIKEVFDELNRRADAAPEIEI